MADWTPISDSRLDYIEEIAVPRTPGSNIREMILELVAEIRRTREALAKLQADSFTVSHLRSVVQRAVEGRDAGHGLSDAEVAGRVRMLTHDQLDHEMICVMARDRIIALSEALHQTTAALVDMDVYFGSMAGACEEDAEAAIARARSIIARRTAEMDIMEAEPRG